MFSWFWRKKIWFYTNFICNSVCVQCETTTKACTEPSICDICTTQSEDWLPRFCLAVFWQVYYYKNYHLIEHTVSIKVIAKWFVIFTNNFNQFISSKMCEKFPNLLKKKFYAFFIIPYVCLIWCNNKCRPLKHPATRVFNVWKSTSLCPFVCLLN